jgi:asparagine synthase (glutamine-hydrolysing)
MCGIAVAVGWDQAEATVRGLMGGLIHRGDVSDPVAVPFPGAAMGTRRLRIVDGDHAVQPMLSFDGRILLSFNGEIYNHKALRRELEGLGVVFRTASDTEVLASALSLWGEIALERLNGMFAFVALDLSNGGFLAARDPLGEKPLYVMQSGVGFVFCSEIRPLLSAVETGEVFQLPPGHLLTRTQLSRYRPALADPTFAGDHDPATLDRLLAEAVQIRLPSDLPCAVLFSGGIDSTLIAHYARQARADIPGYFLGGPASPDFPYARGYADRTAFDMRCLELDVGENPDALIAEVVAMSESFEPDVVRASLCTSSLAQRIHQDGFKVALCGEGADELFAGYVPLELAFSDSQDNGALVREQHLAFMHQTNLQRVDRCTMRFQVEARQPFLDPAIINYALSLDASGHVDQIDGEARGKAALRDLYILHSEELGSDIRDRCKTPLAEGAGFDLGPNASPWREFAEQSISDRAFLDGQRRFSAFDVREKEELLYLSKLSDVMDVTRVPHLRNRARIRFPSIKDMKRLEPYLL